MYIDNVGTRLAWKIRDIHHLHMQNITRVLESYGMHTEQPRILHTIRDMQGATQREIAGKLGISPASLAMSLKRLQKAGFIERKVDESDMRANTVCLTQKGVKAMSDSLTDIIAFDNCLIKGFCPEDIQTLDRLLTQVYSNLLEVKCIYAQKTNSVL